MKDFAEIYVNQKIYTYAVPAGEQAAAEIGCAAEVTLRGKNYTGYILRFVARPEFKTLPVQKISGGSNFGADLVELVGWIADYYKCFPETAVKLITPK
ncbi:MAG: hypothetical protein LBQ83_02540 [Candidatus Margulisbacteria bacterium]|jgi:primosomal protein N'|nr:hypothetical protein [Candidatus Margulisiibacteriota bacterium]